jgi:hypothetical protein
MMHDADDDLPPESTPYADLLRWLERRLGRRPTLAEVAKVRAAQREASRRRARRVPRPTLGGQRAPSPREIVRELLRGPEGMALLAAIGTLPVLLAGLAQARKHDEWLTRPETVQRLAKAAAKPPRVPRFEPSVRHQLEALRAYVEWKLGTAPADDGEPIPAGCMPAEVEGVDTDIAAALNAGTEDAARALLAQIEAASESVARLLLRQLREKGALLRQEYGDHIGWRTAEPPLGLVVEPPSDEPDDDPEKGDDEPTAPPTPTPKGGGRR